jgi:hypothetical protein
MMTKKLLSRDPIFCDRQAVCRKGRNYLTRLEIRRRIKALATDRPGYIAWLKKRYGQSKG